jgi:hypothetical protein
MEALQPASIFPPVIFFASGFHIIIAPTATAPASALASCFESANDKQGY